MKLVALFPNQHRLEKMIAKSSIFLGMVFLIIIVYLEQLLSRSFRLELIWEIRWIFIIGFLFAIGSGIWELFYPQTYGYLWSPFFLVFTFWQLNYIRWLDWDSAVFMQIGRLINSGGLPYVDLWDHKMPGIYYLNAAALYLFGNNRTSVQLNYSNIFGIL